MQDSARSRGMYNLHQSYTGYVVGAILILPPLPRCFFALNPYEAERLIRAVGTFSIYRTYMIANKYVLWLILKLSGRLRFPLFRNEKHFVFQKIRKILHHTYVCNTSKLHIKTRTSTFALSKSQQGDLVELIPIYTFTVLEF